MYKLGKTVPDEKKKETEGFVMLINIINTLEKTIYLYHTTTEQEPPIVPDDVRQRLYKRLDLDEFLGIQE